jgi:hypothetical protein
MAAKSSRPAAKSHARNLAFQTIGGGALLSSRVFWSSVSALEIKLPRDAVWERHHIKIARPTTKTTTPPAKIPLWPVPELSVFEATAFVGVTGSVVTSGRAGTALVSSGGATAGFSSLTTAGAGAEVAVMGAGATAFVGFSGAGVILC